LKNVSFAQSFLFQFGVMKEHIYFTRFLVILYLILGMNSSIFIAHDALVDDSEDLNSTIPDR
jgi:hypothetical protein